MASAQTGQAAAAALEVRVLGKIELHGVPRIHRAKALELIVYLALHPHGVDLDRLWEALWPERPVNRATLHTTVSIARAHLGNAPDHTPYLPTVRDGLYRLHPAVSGDWIRFQTLTQLAVADPTRAITALRQALELVRGIPLDPPAPHGYEWALVQRTEMESAIAAHAAGNPPGVDAIMRELIHVLDAEDEPLDDLHPDTIALYKKLRGTRLLRR
jgi:DNA-binding SARP family transcriptional activator